MLIYFKLPTTQRSIAWVGILDLGGSITFDFGGTLASTIYMVNLKAKEGSGFYSNGGFRSKQATVIQNIHPSESSDT